MIAEDVCVKTPFTETVDVCSAEDFGFLGRCRSFAVGSLRGSCGPIPAPGEKHHDRNRTRMRRVEARCRRHPVAEEYPALRAPFSWP